MQECSDSCQSIPDGSVRPLHADRLPLHFPNSIADTRVIDAGVSPGVDRNRDTVDPANPGADLYRAAAQCHWNVRALVIA